VQVIGRERMCLAVWTVQRCMACVDVGRYGIEWVVMTMNLSEDKRT
jgi:hypothetical protein